jgi:hypothetical protein
MAACGTQSGDPHSNNGAPPPGGTDLRIRDLVDPSKEGHADLVSTTQAVSGAVVIAVDTYDETNDGKGTGTVYVQDLGAKKETPYSGISLFATTFSPGNLAVAPGDVLDLRGQYQENQQIPSKPPVIFPPGALLVQLTQPTATFRFETQVPEPVDIDAAELSDYAKARQWIGMLVRINHVVIPTDPFDAASGRFSIDLSLPKTTACDAPFPRPASLVNDLFDLKSLGLKNGDKIASITGVVGFFCNVKLAPRSAADVQR